VLVYITCVSVIGLAIERPVSRPLHAEASRPRETRLESGTALGVAGNGRYARKVVIACKRERARRLHTVAPRELAVVAKSDPSLLIFNEDDMRRASASALS
jgi:hypothetical protein